VTPCHGIFAATLQFGSSPRRRRIFAEDADWRKKAHGHCGVEAAPARRSGPECFSPADKTIALHDKTRKGTTRSCPKLWSDNWHSPGLVLKEIQWNHGTPSKI